MTYTNIASYDPTTLRFFARWEEFEDIRHPEDGEMVLGRYICVVAEAPNGARFYRDVGYMTHKVEYVGEHNDPVVVRQADWKVLMEAAKSLEEKLEELPAPRLNPENWGFAGSVYGSELYQQMEARGELV